MMEESNKKWWHQAIGYQIYPKSFQDTNGDGIGDINGIIAHLDDLKELGITVLWISPINVSPMVDNGYDISDYLQIDPSFGTNTDFERLIDEAKQRGIRVLMDLVINHTSTEHPWFKQAMSDLTSEYADYYVIKEGKGTLPPNNWRSIFGGSAWEKIGDTNRYYLHLFTVGQPDLNWENPRLREELYQIIRYWLDKGIAGFRIDAITHIKKIYDYQELPADGPDNLVNAWDYYRDAKGIGHFLGEMRDSVFKGRDLLNIAEMDIPDTDKWEEYFGADGYFSSVFDFSHIDYSVQKEAFKETPLDMIEALKQTLMTKQLKADNRVFFTNFLENHDLPRSLNRLIPADDIGFYSASVWAMMYMCLKGIPVIYQGQEIGMTDFPKEDITEYLDLATHNQYKDYLYEGLSEKEALHIINRESRENSRTPMQWNDQKEAGFTTGKPWFAVNPNYGEINYKTQQATDSSLLHVYKKLISLRQDMVYNDTFVYGNVKPLYSDVKGCIAYSRELEEQKISVICNMTHAEMHLSCPPPKKLLFTNYNDLMVDEHGITLKPYQGIIIL